MRLFIAILFGDDIIKSLQEVQERLRDAGIEGRFMPEENLHMILVLLTLNIWTIYAGCFLHPARRLNASMRWHRQVAMRADKLSGRQFGR